MKNVYLIGIIFIIDRCERRDSSVICNASERDSFIYFPSPSRRSRILSRNTCVYFDLREFQ